MPAGATTEGSIVGYLRLDDSDWNETLDRAEAKARELGRVDPNIRVTADTASAVAKLEAVRLAQEKVDFATQRLQISYLRLDEAQSKGGVSAARLAGLHLSAARAESAHETATKKLAAAQLALAAADDVEERSAAKSASTNKMNVTRMGLIVALVAALLPMAAPLAGYVVSISGALAGMGAAGVLAILGIKNAMAAGTDQGAQYSQGLQILKGDLSELENTAATRMLQSFDAAIYNINSHMPELNAEVGMFSGQLGSIGNTVLSAVINAFRILNPLFLAGGQYVERLAEGFLSWTQNGGLQRFANYAMSTLPLVENTLGALANAVVHILDALAPLGTVGLVVLQDVSDVINALPVPVLLDLITIIGVGTVAFKAWGFVAPMLAAVTEAAALASGSVTLLGVSMEIATGPIGWVIAGLSALAAVVAVTSFATQQAKASADSYAEALRQDNGAIGDNVRAQAAKALVDAGAISAAKALGLSASMVTNAALGQAPAMRAVNEAVKGATAEYTKAVAGQGQYGEVSSKTLAADQAKADAAKTLKDAIAAQAAAIQNAVKYGIDYNAAMNLGGSVSETLARDLGMTVGAYERLTASQNNATAAAKTWKTETDILNGVNQSLEQATINLASDYQTMATTITGNIKSMGKAAATSLDVNTAGGLANHQIILKAVQDAQAKAEQIDLSVAKETGSKAKGDAAAATFAASEKQRIVDSLANLGLNRQAVQDVVDTLDTLHSPPPVVVSVETSAAMSKLDALHRAMASVGVTASTASAFTALANANAAMGRAAGHADGGPIYRAAGGPIEAAYLASGGNPFAPRGTDTIPAMLTLGEFVVRQPAAAYDPQFLKAYNQNPQKALHSVAGQGAVTHNHYNMTVVTQADPVAAVKDGLRRLAMMTS